MGDDELIELRSGDWALWRWVAVRAAGFPVGGLDLFGPGDEAGRLAGLAGDPALREALTWQNRDVLRNALDRIDLEGSAGKRRRRVEVIASYWQRYCAKNDTIGFFGPLGWGRITDDGPALTVEPGEQLLADRATRFEVWAVDALAAALATDVEVKPWIPPVAAPIADQSASTSTKQRPTVVATVDPPAT